MHLGLGSLEKGALGMDASLLPVSALPHSCLPGPPGSSSQHQLGAFPCLAVRVEMEKRRDKGRGGIGGRKVSTGHNRTDATVR